MWSNYNVFILQTSPLKFSMVKSFSNACFCRYFDLFVTESGIPNKKK